MSETSQENKQLGLAQQKIFRILKKLKLSEMISVIDTVRGELKEIQEVKVKEAQALLTEAQDKLNLFND